MKYDKNNSLVEDLLLDKYLRTTALKAVTAADLSEKDILEISFETEKNDRRLLLNILDSESSPINAKKDEFLKSALRHIVPNKDGFTLAFHLLSQYFGLENNDHFIKTITTEDLSGINSFSFDSGIKSDVYYYEDQESLLLSILEKIKTLLPESGYHFNMSEMFDRPSHMLDFFDEKWINHFFPSGVLKITKINKDYDDLFLESTLGETIFIKFSEDFSRITMNSFNDAGVNEEFVLIKNFLETDFLRFYKKERLKYIYI